MPYRLATPQYNTDFIHPTHKAQVSVMRIMKKAGIQALAERVGFEPTEELPSLVFKTSSISRSDISPYKSTSPYVRSISSMAENFVGDSGPLHSRCECLDALPKKAKIGFLTFSPSMLYVRLLRKTYCTAKPYAIHIELYHCLNLAVLFVCLASHRFIRKPLTIR